MGDTVLEARGLAKAYPGLFALDGVDLELRRGEIHSLVGQNGAGKSTLIKVLTGVVQPDAGTIVLGGRPVRFRSPADASRSGIAVVHQETSLVRRLDAAENLFLGRPYPTRGPLRLVDWREVYARASSELSGLHPGLPVRIPAERLSPAHQTLIAIARALSVKASILILDEPTASLTDEEVGHLFSVLRSLRAQGNTIVYVSHRLHEVLQLSDRVTVMRDGAVVACREASGLTGPELVRLMTGRRLDQAYPPRMGSSGDDVALEVSGLTGRTLKGASLRVRRGEVLGVAGLTGSGRSELLRLLAGAQRAVAGEVRMDGRRLTPGSPGEALRAGIAMVPEERRAHALFPAASVKENISVAHLSSFAAGGWWLRHREEERCVQQLVDRLRIRLRHLNQPVAELSGGNQQKAVFARFLTRPPRLLLLDEPTRGVDVATKFELYEIVRNLAGQGTAVILVSSELPELLGLSDRLLVLHGGTVAATLQAEGTSEAVLSSYMYGRRPA